jgi:hypothetical protein
METLNTYEMHTYDKPQFCEGCGEGMNYEMAYLLDGFDNVHPYIEEICMWCLKQELGH